MSVASPSLADQKRALRRALRARVRALTPGERETAGEAIAARVADSAEFSRCARLGLYSALPDEVTVTALLERALAAGKRVLYPRLDAQGGLELAPAARDALVPGRYGVLAPRPEIPPVELAPDDLLLLPGVAFTRSGARLGRGGGHYDRLLRAIPAPAFGVAFELQIEPALPMEAHDQRVRAVVTERGIWRATE
jgi:5-formyltetrahydrofolate cyclo-ligase